MKRHNWDFVYSSSYWVRGRLVRNERGARKTLFAVKEIFFRKPSSRLTALIAGEMPALPVKKLSRRLPKTGGTQLDFEVCIVPDSFSMPGQFEVMIERNFSSAHQLRGYKGKCENLHGHNYRIEIYARGSELDNIGLLIDFVELKAAADDVVQYLDHRNINELPPFDELQPSAENLAKYILERVGSKITDERVQIYKVRCFETPTSVATYQVGQ